MGFSITISLTKAKVRLYKTNGIAKKQSSSLVFPNISNSSCTSIKDQEHATHLMTILKSLYDNNVAYVKLETGLTDPSYVGPDMPSSSIYIEDGSWERLWMTDLAD